MLMNFPLPSRRLEMVPPGGVSDCLGARKQFSPPYLSSNGLPTTLSRQPGCNDGIREGTTGCNQSAVKLTDPSDYVASCPQALVSCSGVALHTAISVEIPHLKPSLGCREARTRHSVR
ncbi:hypothetical protein DPEC_G00333240 [Dallia pectoralis]|uniref:Uncharacterized protein n=1 Tax=Dallia pectoralis TaxID=75939 RepID=A0ACC2F6A4_DALPE|nr:hypothetical protein DPEC_G00333240 [Dallia pectoralis]